MNNSCYLIIYWNYDDMTAKVMKIYYSGKAARIAFDKKLVEYRKPDRSEIPEEEYLQLAAFPVDVLDEDDLITLPDDEGDFSTYAYFDESEDLTTIEFIRI